MEIKISGGLDVNYHVAHLQKTGFRNLYMREKWKMENNIFLPVTTEP